ncbi:MAG: hypothetical protein RQ741_05725 [Wenzhouxiangellaceae bacterium]|nr:hypothetical protein [Wenzhouxiangellaceae bacterium]
MILIAGSVVAQPEPAGAGEIHQLDRQFDVKPGTALRIVNPYGNVRIREVPLGAPAQLRVTVQTEAGQPNPAAITERTAVGDESGVATDHATDLTIILTIVAAPDRVAANGPTGDPMSEGNEAILDRIAGFLRADFVLAVPDSVELEIELVDGDFTMHGATYPVKLRARSGHINLRTAGRVDVEVGSGHVIYNQNIEGPVHGGRIQTSRAPVDILRADAAELRYRVVSGAAVTTDSQEILQSRSRDGRAWVFGLEQAAATLEIQTDSAPVRLVAEGIR